MNRDARPGTKLGVYLKELPGMVSKDAASMFVKEHKFTPMNCVQHRALWASKRRAAARKTEFNAQ